MELQLIRPLRQQSPLKPTKEAIMKTNAVALVIAAGLAILPAVAQDRDQAPSQSAQQGGMMMQNGMMQNGMHGMGKMLGMHVMAVTVTALDAKTGMVDATAGGMALKLHFPPASLADVKTGDKLSVHMGFTKS
jgi:hypothetical protein